MSHHITSLGISSEQDMVAIRQRARQISASLGFGSQDQVRIATAVSELSRTAFVYTSGGRVVFSVEEIGRRPLLLIRIKSVGGELRENATSGAPEQGDSLQDAVINANRLMDSCTLDDEGGRAKTITLRKYLPSATSVTNALLADLSSQISSHPISNTFIEVKLQNKELLDTLAEVRTKQDDLLALTQELEDTNRGVVALYADIEDKAERLRQADEMKSRFLSNTSHELRTPLSSIRALSGLLLDRVDGELTVEQEKQIRFIEQAASQLSELVNDLLDMAKIESGKIDVHTAMFSVSDLFSTLRGMLRPLAINPQVELLFDDPVDGLMLNSDEGKITQILRNFVSNALKFTEAGSVTVSARRDAEAGTTTISVADTGIGITADNHQFVFEEFSQIESPLQRQVKGTGLGLPLCRKLAHLLGGEITLSSVAGSGSTFSLILPVRAAGTGDGKT